MVNPVVFSFYSALSRPTSIEQPQQQQQQVVLYIVKYKIYISVYMANTVVFSFYSALSRPTSIEQPQQQQQQVVNETPVPKKK